MSQKNSSNHIQLPKKSVKVVKKILSVKRGRYSSAFEVVRAALRLLEEREMERLVKLEELRKEIAIGIGDLDRGDVFDGEEVLRELRVKN